jgi:hypothetical protein
LDHFDKDCFYCVATSENSDESDAAAAAALLKLATGSSHQHHLFRRNFANNKLFASMRGAAGGIPKSEKT